MMHWSPNQSIYLKYFEFNNNGVERLKILKINSYIFLDKYKHSMKLIRDRITIEHFKIKEK